MGDLYNKYIQRMQKIADVLYASAVLQWDQETYMPPKGASIRARQLATLAGIAHELATDKELGDILNELHASDKLNEKQKKNIAHSLRDYNIRKKYPNSFVQELTLTLSEAFVAWSEAKEKNDYNLYAPKLKKLIALKQKETQLLGYEKHPYDALLDQYEPGCTTHELDVLFNDVKTQLVPFIKSILTKPAPKDDFMYLHYDAQKQWDFGIELLKQMHYDFGAGRQDKSSHPFTIHFCPNDVRVTTRIDEHNLHEMIWSTIHEGGHALYEQGIPQEEYGLPSGEAISLGVHESQSRIWENNVGRSINYWKGNFALLQKYFPKQLKDVNVDMFYKAMNKIQASLIRTNADELTYHLHILIRYEIEKKIIESELNIDELPEYWNNLYLKYLDIKVPDDKQGILQDIHWSHGSFGYFPTYSIGSFYAAQFFDAAEKQISDLHTQIENGNMLPLLQWLRTHIHQHGKTLTAHEICKYISGQYLNFSYFMNYVKNKYSDIYNL